MPSPLFQKLQAIVDDFECGDWQSSVLSPQLYAERIDADFALLPNPTTAARQAAGQGQWAIVFERPAGPNSRGGPSSRRPLEAIVTFGVDDVRAMEPRQIRNAIIGVIAEREFHEVLEWAQLRTVPNVPIVDPHVDSEDLHDVVERVSRAILEHAV